jgi:cysteine-rich repeat protein
MKNIIIFYVLVFVSIQSFANNGFLDIFKNTNDKKDKTLIIFYRPDCQYCQQMEQTLAKEQTFSKSITQKYNVQVIDITSSEGKLLASKFDVHAVPTIINYDNSTGVATTIKGFGNINKFALKIDVAYQNSNEIKPTENKITLAACGDGIVNAGESCDDGNASNGDGCSATCTVEAGYNCTGSPSNCTPSGVCGDGIVTVGESCDDGNVSNGDGCNSTCNVEPGFSCSGSPSICTTICGDGIVGAGEQCDDGNTTNGDGCSATCTYETPTNDNCIGAISLPSVTGTNNGQNISATTSTGVPSACSLLVKDVWFTFTLASSRRIKMELNGPSIIDPVLAIYSGTCAALTIVACDDDSGPGAYSLIEAILPAGTYFVRAGSYNTTNPGTFSLVYDLNITCGNNILELNEECDDGNIANGDGCSSICKTENAASIVGVAINTDATRAAPSAMLDVKSFDRGVLVPRMSTTQRTAIAAPAKGLLVFDITTNTFWYFGTGWTEIGGQTGVAGSGLPAGTANQTLRSNGTNWVPNNTLQNDGTNVTVTGQVKITGGSPAVGKVLTSDAAGLATWQAAAGSVAFNVRLDSNRTLIPAAADIRLHFGSYGNFFGNFNTGAFNTSTDEFVAPSAGLYSFTFELLAAALSTEYLISTSLKIDNSVNAQKTLQIYRDVVAPNAANSTFSHSILVTLDVGDKVYLISKKTSGGGTSNGVIDFGSNGAPYTSFMGYKIN